MKIGLSYLLAFCATGEGGGIDNSCSSTSSSGGGGQVDVSKLSQPTKDLVIKAAQASIKAKEETNPLKAAKLHGTAMRANEKAAKAIDKENLPSTAKNELVAKFYLKSNKHKEEATKVASSVLGATKGLKELRSDAKLASEQAKAATKATMIGMGQGVKFYGTGQANPGAKVRMFEAAAAAHEKAAAAHEKAFDKVKANTHAKIAEGYKKQAEYYKGF